MSAGLDLVRNTVFDALAEIDTDSAAVVVDEERVAWLRLSTGEAYLVTVQAAEIRAANSQPRRGE